MSYLSDEALKAQREYKRRWREKNREKVQAYNAQYWEKKAQQIINAKENATKEAD